MNVPERIRSDLAAEAFGENAAPTSIDVGRHKALQP